MPTEYQSNRTVIVVQDVNHRGSAFRLAVHPTLEDVDTCHVSRDRDVQTLTAIVDKMSHYAARVGLTVRAEQSSLDRPREEVDIDNCIDVLKRNLARRGR